MVGLDAFGFGMLTLGLVGVVSVVLPGHAHFCYSQ